ncbi:low molecular weight protein-tyrosine-phosphatase [Anaerotruncus colihominis]|uniref:low molecular weight protein-tyrosine-phosphatase n=1 Tax=Anaerotruncus colihominis TaxID=169435 RepID=UPI0018A0C4AF|nr:low molecular weight protein-tyrosine-phosphatase [Anaerotruncus colihominis]
MIKVLFICHGNICRSPMAEFVFQDMAARRGLSDRIYAASAATSREEIGNPPHRGTQSILRRYGIPMYGHRAVQIIPEDYDRYDYLIGMDSYNLSNMCRIFGGDPDNKIRRLLDFSSAPRDISDPWYTGDFEATYADVYEGCEALLDQLTASLR